MARKNIMRRFKINEISAVDRPAQQEATVRIMKSATSPNVAVQVAVGAVDARSYLKKSAADAYTEHRRQVEAAAQVELQKMRSTNKSGGVLEPYKPVQSRPDIYASLEPGTISGNEAFNVDNALSKLREMSEARRRAEPRLTREQAFALVYQENPELAAREREQRLALRDGAEL